MDGGPDDLVHSDFAESVEAFHRSSEFWRGMLHEIRQRRGWEQWWREGYGEALWQDPFRLWPNLPENYASWAPSLRKAVQIFQITPAEGQTPGGARYAVKDMPLFDGDEEVNEVLLLVFVTLTRPTANAVREFIEWFMDPTTTQNEVRLAVSAHG